MSRSPSVKQCFMVQLRLAHASNICGQTQFEVSWMFLLKVQILYPVGFEAAHIGMIDFIQDIILPMSDELL